MQQCVFYHLAMRASFIVNSKSVYTKQTAVVELTVTNSLLTVIHCTVCMYGAEAGDSQSHFVYVLSLFAGEYSKNLIATTTETCSVHICTWYTVYCKPRLLYVWS